MGSTVAAAVVATLGLGLVVPLALAPTAAAATGTATGVVFNDYDVDGVMDAGEAGVEGAVVYAYDSSGNRFGPATTSSTGAYSVSLSPNATAGPIRIELTSMPEGFFPSRAGTDNATTIRFATFTDGGTVSDLDFGIQKPQDFCSSNPDIATTVFCVGEGNSSATTFDALWHSNYDSSTRTGVATPAEVGSLAAVAWDPVTRSVFAASYVKRHAGLNDTYGADALYKMDPDTDTTTHWVDLYDDLGIDVGQADIPSNAVRDLVPWRLQSADPIFDEVGKRGIGDIETNGSDTLYVTNLYQLTVHAIPIPADGSAPTSSSSLGLPGSAISCTNGTARPFALAYQDGYLYSGVVCDAASGTVADLDAYVVRTTGDGTWTQVGPRIDLDYPQKGQVFVDSFRLPNGDQTTDALNLWHIWDDSFDTSWDSGANSTSTGSASFIIRPTPMLSDIAFDDDGSMVLAFRDRTGDMIGADNWAPLAADGTAAGISPGGPDLIFAMSGGELLRLCATGGTYVLEGSAGCANNAANGQGTGGGEYYPGDSNTNGHKELSNGHVAIAPRTGELLLSATNAEDGTANSGGIRGIDNATGAHLSDLSQNYYENARPVNNVAVFGKANGIGDLEALCDAAPLEVGNRVWSDTNGDGIQDPGETGIDGVTVQLFAATDTGFTTPLGTAETADGGQYYFRTGLSEPAVGNGDNVGGGLAYRQDFVIRVGSAADYASGPLAGLNLSPSGQAPSYTYSGDSTWIDSNPTAGVGAIGSAWRPTMALSAAAMLPGHNDHTFDVGFVPPRPHDLALRKSVVGMTGTPASGTVTFQLEVFNQTADAVDGVTLTDYVDTDSFLAMTTLPAPGTTGGDAALPYSWDNSVTTAPEVTIDGVIPGNSSVTLNVTLTIASPVNMAGLLNTAEITRFDNDGNSANGDSTTGTVYDVDSIPDAVNTDALVDDEIDLQRWTNTSTSSTEDGGVADEDDHDVAIVPVYDLALIKTRSSGQDAIITTPSTTASFDITVKNQGQTDAFNVTVLDSPSMPLSRSASTAASQPATTSPSGTAVTVTYNAGNGTFTIPALAAGESVTFTMLADLALVNDVQVNTAEITGFDNDSNSGNAKSTWVQDVDSTPDTDPGNDDREVVGSSTFPEDSHNDIDRAPINGVNGADEDDHDSEAVQLGLLRLGSTVYIDANDNNVGDAGEEVAGVRVQLLKYNGSTYDVVAETITNSDGDYSFDRLYPGVYQVGIPADQTTAGDPQALTEYEPVTGSVANPETNNFDNDGDAEPGFLSRSDDITLTHDGEPTNDGADKTDADALTSPRAYSDANSNLNVDFVFEAITYTLGNLVWRDTGAGANYNNGVADDDESGIPNVDLALYRDNGAGGAVANDGILAATERIATTSTDPNGFYEFEGLSAADDYVVVVLTGGGLPAGYGTSGSPIDVASADGVDNDNNGVVDASLGWASGAISLGPVAVAEPTGETDGTTETGAQPAPSVADDRADQTVDFGFVPSIRIGNQVWRDQSDSDPVTQVATDNNGVFDAGELGIGGVTVELWLDADDSGEFERGGADGSTPLQSTTTTSEGNYWFDGVRPDRQYFVVIPSIGGVGIDRPASSDGQSSNPTGSDNDDDGAPGTFDIAVSLPFVPTESGASEDEADAVEPGDGSSTTDANAEAEANARPGVVQYADDNSELAIDFGFINVPVYRVGNLVWLDNGGPAGSYVGADEGNGIADAQEPGIPGVTVVLYAASDLAFASPLDTTVTNGDGEYVFENLAAGDYRVRVDLGGANSAVLAGLTSATDGAVANSDTDNDDDGRVVSTAVASTTVTLGPLNHYVGGEPNNEERRDGTGVGYDQPGSLTPSTSDPATYANNRSNLTVDFGFVKPYRIGNLVWLDLNNDGVAQDGEPGLPTVRVELRDPVTGALLADVATDSAGHYEFTGLAPGTYAVKVDTTTLPAGLIVSGPTQTANADNDVDNDTNAGAAAGVVSGPAATVTVGGVEPTNERLRSDDATDDDADSFADDQSNYTVDFGFWNQLRLGNVVWHDESDTNPATYVATDNNGEVDAGETLLSGVTVSVWLDGGDGAFDAGTGSGDDTFAGSDVTDAEGNWLVTELAAGTYFAAIETLPAPYAEFVSSLGQSVGSGDNDDNGASVTDGAGDPYVAASAPISLAVGAAPTGETDTLPAADGSAESEATGGGLAFPDANSDLTVDFSFVAPPTYRIGNLVWRDTNADGIADAGEPGIEGVLVRLENAAGNVINETVTDASGAYEFTEDAMGTPLAAGDYRIAIPSNQLQTLGLALPVIGGALNGAINSPGTGDPDTDLDDNDDNGVPFAGGWQSELVTLGDDSSTFESEPTNEVLRSGGDDDLGWAGGTDARSEFTVDFGFYFGLRLGDTVWLDNGRTGAATFDPTQENDGIYQSTELPAPGVTVYLFADDGDGVFEPGAAADDGAAIASTTTDADGEYFFTGLDDGGRYFVAIPAAETATGGDLVGLRASTPTWADGAGTNDRNHGAAAGGYASVSPVIVLTRGGMAYGDAADEANANLLAKSGATVTDGDSNLVVDFGFSPAPTYRLGNLVWLDTNDNGSVDLGEQGIGDVPVMLYADDGNGVLDLGTDTFMGLDTTGTTGADKGRYGFDDLPAGTYFVVVLWDSTLAGLDSSQVREADANNDVDNDNNALPLGTTPSDGWASSAVELGAISPKGETDEPTGEVDDNTVVSAEDGTYLDGRSNQTVDFGFAERVRIGNQVWRDESDANASTHVSTDNDGEFNGTEVGIGGVTVELWNDVDGDGFEAAGDDVLVDTTTTSTEGNYWFDNLIPGEYYVAIPSIGSPFTTARSSAGQSTATSDADNDDDGAPLAGYLSVSLEVAAALGTAATGEQDAIEPGDGSSTADANAEVEANGGTVVGTADANSHLDVDFGFVEVPLYRVGNLVWLDANNNGIADAGEDPISGVLVQLLNAAGDVMAETVTDGSGEYLFENLAAGDYSVRVPSSQTEELSGGLSITAGALDNLASSTADAGDPDADADDNDDNGATVTGGWQTGVLTLGSSDDAVTETEPTNETHRDGGDDDSGWAGGTDARSNLTVDFGFYQLLRLGDIVWLDNGGTGASFDPTLEDNGVYDPSVELTISGVSVELFADGGDGVFDGGSGDDTSVGTTTTVGGAYFFTGLTEGTYFAAIPDSEHGSGQELENLRSSTGQAADDSVNDRDQGEPATGWAAVSHPIVMVAGGMSNGDAAFESRADTATGTSVVDSSSNLAIDFGFSPVPTYALGNLVWEDYDDDGVADLGEPGISGVTVEVYRDVDGSGTLNAGDTFAGSTTTAAGPDTGRYRFTALAAGDYIVHIPSQGTLAGWYVGGTPETVADLGNSVAVDNNNDAQPDGVNGGWTASPVTLGGAAGPADHDEPVGEVDGIDNADAEALVYVRDDRSNQTVDFGFWRGLRLGNQVWLDEGAGANQDNGVYDADESFLVGVGVSLFLDNGDNTFDPSTDSLVDTTNTGAEGRYFFSHLDEGDYFVAVPSGPAGTRSSTGAPGASLTVDGQDAGEPAGTYVSVSELLTLTRDGAPTGETDGPGTTSDDAEAYADGVTGPYLDGDSYLTVDFGLIDVPTYRLGNLVWHDLNNDGLAQDGEPGIDGVLVQLTDAAGTVLEETVTAGGGKYEFTDLVAGDYRIQVPDGQVPAVTPSLASSIVAGALDGFFPSTVASSTPDDDEDNDSNGAQVSTVVRTGVVSIGGSEPVTEQLRVDDSTDDDLGQTSPRIDDDRSNFTVDLGFYAISLGNMVFTDSDADGVYEPADGDAGVDLVTVELRDASGALVDTQVTSGGGLYLFTGLVSGEQYYVQIPASEFATGGTLEGWFSSPGDAGTIAADDTDGLDRGVDPATAFGAVRSNGLVTASASASPVTDGTGDNPDNDDVRPDAAENLTVDFGVSAMELGGTVFLDSDNDGIDTDEGDFEDITLLLFNGDGSPYLDASGSQATTVTDASGDYRFIGLPQGDYIVEIPATEFAEELAGHANSDGNEPTPDANLDAVGEDEGDPVSGDIFSEGAVRASVVTLAVDTESDADPTPSAGYADRQSNLTVDFGFWHAQAGLELGNQLWFDENRNGLFDRGELPVPATVEVELLDANTGAVLATEYTNVAGQYLFAGLAPGDYRVRVTGDNFRPGRPLAGYTTTDGAAISSDPNDGTDSDSNGPVVTVPPGPALGLALMASGVESATVTLRAAAPIDEDDPASSGLDDRQSDLTLDFGFIRADELAFTGADVGGTVGNAAALVLLGLALVVGGRRKRA